MSEAARRILAVDDDPDLLRLLTIRLKSAGYEVTAVESGEKAIADLKATLTPAQWEKLPASMKTLPAGRGPGGDAVPVIETAAERITGPLRRPPRRP